MKVREKKFELKQCEKEFRFVDKDDPEFWRLDKKRKQQRKQLKLARKMR